jgi:hypothetical protein
MSNSFNCLPCPECNSEKLIPNVYIGKPTLVQIHCHECGFDGEKADTQREAILKWNVECTSRRRKSINE